MDDELTNRRGLMRGIAQHLARRAREAASAHSEIRDQLGQFEIPASAEEAVIPLEEGGTFLPAQLTERCATREELLELADECGLVHRRDAVREHCRPSVRLTASAPNEAAAWPALDSWPSWKGAPLSLMLAPDLAELAAACPEAELPAAGTLGVFCATGDSPSGLTLDDAGRCQVVASTEPLKGCPTVEASGELTLPRVWSETIDALELSSDEQAAWEQLRLRLAELQGVRAFDAEDTPRAIHRVLGWPDERLGWMPLACALLEEGIELAGQPPAMHARAQELSPRAGEWRLLLQLSEEPRLGWVWGGEGRLYIWIKEADLKAGDFGHVRAFVP
jgi:Domain of unknown function (DUF1963)